MTDDNFKLTRRKALAGLTTIGIAGAGAGMGTSALFSDEESADNNSITAGTLDLEVEIKLVDVSGQFNLAVASGSSLQSAGDTILINGDESEEDADGSTVSAANLSFVLDDVKPGDWWVVKECVRINGNPGYVNRKASNVTNSPGDTTEPEPGAAGEDQNPSDTTDDGELGRYLRVRSGDGYDASGSGVANRYGDSSDPISLDGDGSITFSGNLTSNPLDLFFAGTLNHSLWAESADLSGEYDPDLDMVLTNPGWNGLTYSKVRGPVDRDGDNTADWDHTGAGPGFGDVRDGQDPSNGTPTPKPAEPTAIGPDSETLADTKEVCIYSKYFVPKEVGNVIQGDSISYERSWRAEQVRNNDVNDPFASGAPGDP